MNNKYENFYKDDWVKAYTFWHGIINRDGKQVNVIKDSLKKFDKAVVKILDVGCGEGNEINKALSEIEGKKFRISANDISKEALEKYAKNNSKYLETFYETKLEKLPEDIKDTFDFVLFSHSLYGVELNNLFQRYLNFIDEGLMLIFLESRNSNNNIIRKKFWRQVHKSRLNENDAEDIISNLLNNGMDYETIDILYEVDFTKLGDNGMTDLYIPFLFRSRNINLSILKEIENYIKSLTKNNKISGRTIGILISKK